MAVNMNHVALGAGALAGSVVGYLQTRAIATHTRSEGFNKITKVGAMGASGFEAFAGWKLGQDLIQSGKIGSSPEVTRQGYALLGAGLGSVLGMFIGLAAENAERK